MLTWKTELNINSQKLQQIKVKTSAAEDVEYLLQVNLELTATHRREQSQANHRCRSLRQTACVST